MSRRRKKRAPAPAASPVKPPQVVGMLESSPRKFLGMDFAEIVSQVSMLQMATAQIPALAADHVRKAWRQMERTQVDRGPKALFIDPFDTASSALGWKERRSGFGFEVLKEVERQLAVLRAIVNVRCAQVSAFAEPYDEANNLGYTVTLKDRTRAPSMAARKRARDITSFVAGCGQPRRNPQSQVKRDRFDVFMRKIVRDSLVFDSVGIEIVPDEDGTPFEFYALDGTTIRFAPSMAEQAMGYDSGSIAARVAAYYDDVRYDPMAADGNPARFIQVINNQPVASFSDRELIYGVRNPRSDIYVAGYGYSELEQAISIVTALVDTEKYQSNLFRNGTMPRGILNLKGTEWTPEQMECVPEDTAVYTDRGALPIRTIFDRQVSGEKFKFWNGVRFADGFASESGEKKILNLRCVDGTDFRCSPNHRMFVMTDDGIVERFASELAPGDLLIQVWHAQHGFVSRHRWGDVLGMFDAENGAALSLRPVAMECVSDAGHAPTLDITIVGDEPRFVAEGFLTHNSLKRAWTQQLQGQGNAHRMPIIQFDGDMQFVNMQASHRDMEYSRYHEFLVALLCGVYLCDPEEIALSSMRTSEQTPLFTASSEWKLKASRDRGLKPLLRFLAGLMQQIVDQIDDAFQFRFLGLDEPSEQDKHQRRLEELATVKTLDEVRAAMGLPLYHDRRVGQMIMSPTLLQATKLADEQDMMTAQRAASVAPTQERERNDDDDAGTRAHLS